LTEILGKYINVDFSFKPGTMHKNDQDRF